MENKAKQTILNQIKEIKISFNRDNQVIQSLLNDLENKHKQDLFIKTHICSNCNDLEIEVWFKE